MLDGNKNRDPNKTAISFNRTRGSLLPSKNQAKGDLIPMDPITSVIHDKYDYT